MPSSPDVGEPDPQDPDRRRLVRIAVESTRQQWQPGPGAAEEYDACLASIASPSGETSAEARGDGPTTVREILVAGVTTEAAPPACSRRSRVVRSP
ncbi:hypothetical protein Ae406Ps2_1204c [Pseudonocardia sp. Ae406_Ps2]|nr:MULTISPECIES: hypothetical protein [unclassified Pseudonocardia]OLM01204.1 hypothetical protein Ae406Ps2_1204c [Pseudonocardia sp. Ae406_Ps2]OLM14195.1 hypothetical protein Ae505Ps2_4325 [Pseudonocardia sp. Ae505_Ps2]